MTSELTANVEFTAATRVVATAVRLSDGEIGRAVALLLASTLATLSELCGRTLDSLTGVVRAVDWTTGVVPRAIRLVTPLLVTAAVLSLIIVDSTVPFITCDVCSVSRREEDALTAVDGRSDGLTSVFVTPVTTVLCPAEDLVVNAVEGAAPGVLDVTLDMLREACSIELSIVGEIRELRTTLETVELLTAV